MTETIKSTSDERVKNNTMRMVYKVLNDQEKSLIDEIKIKGQEFYDVLDKLEEKYLMSREISLSKTKIEEAVMWAIKQVTK